MSFCLVFTGPAGVSSLRMGVCPQNSALGGVAGFTGQAGQDQERELSHASTGLPAFDCDHFEAYRKRLDLWREPSCYDKRGPPGASTGQGLAARRAAPSSEPVPVSGQR